MICDATQKPLLKHQMSLYLPQQGRTNFLLFYNLTRIKRLFIRTLLIFCIQFSIISSLNGFMGLAFYLPIASNFILFYFLGASACFGLLLGSFIAYTLLHLSPMAIILYMLADTGCGYLSAVLCNKVFSSDIKPFFNTQEFGKFFIRTAFITCLLSSLIRMVAFIWDSKEPLSVSCLLSHGVSLWLADLNAVVILAGFLFTWLCVVFSRENITQYWINKIQVMFFIFFFIVTVLFLKYYESIYLMTFEMLFVVYMAYYSGALISTLLLFMISNLYLAYFIVHKSFYLESLGVELYFIIPLCLLFYVIGILYVSHRNWGLNRISTLQ